MIRFPKVITKLFVSPPPPSTKSVEPKSVHHKGRTWKQKFNAYIQSALIYFHLKRSEKKEPKTELKTKTVSEIAKNFQKPEVGSEVSAANQKTTESKKPHGGKVADLAENVAHAVEAELPKSAEKSEGKISSDSPEVKSSTYTPVKYLNEILEKGDTHLKLIQTQNELIKKMLEDEKFKKSISKADLNYLRNWSEEYDKYYELNKGAEIEIREHLEKLLTLDPTTEDFDTTMEDLKNCYNSENIKKYQKAEKDLFLKSNQMQQFADKNKGPIGEFVRKQEVLINQEKSPENKEKTLLVFEPHNLPMQRLTRVFMPLEGVQKIADKVGMRDNSKKNLGEIISSLQQRSAAANENKRLSDFEHIFQRIGFRTSPAVISNLVDLLNLTTSSPPIVVSGKDITQEAIKIAKKDARKRIKDLKKNLHSDEKAKDNRFQINDDRKAIKHYYEKYADYSLVSQKKYDALEILYQKRFPSAPS